MRSQNQATEGLRQISLWLALLALMLLAAPTLYSLYLNIWPQEQYSHGMLIPVVFCWLVYRQKQLFKKDETVIPVVTSAAFILVGVLMLTLGRVSTLLLVETLALLPLVTGIILLFWGTKTLRELRFPILFIVLMVPLPGIIMYTLTATLKAWNAEVAVELLYHLGYPVAIDGVVITIGGYQLYLADACAGINSLFALLSLGLLFIYLMPSRSTLRKAVLALAILPVAILSNLVRVVVILLLTYHLSDEIADRIHDLIGYLIFLAALYLLYLFDQKLIGEVGK